MQRAIALLASAARRTGHFAPADDTREIVCALDTASGIDVLHTERAAGGMRPRNRTASRSELDRRPAWGTPSPRWGFACSLPVPS